MTFIESIRTCFTKYTDFNGRATRSEYWWFVLFTVLVTTVLDIVDSSFIASTLFLLLVLLPVFSVSVRRLHDTNRSGWYLLFDLIPLIGWILLTVWTAQKSVEEANRYGTHDETLI
ncbi:MAG: Integral rane protein [Solimicrobium sp.]|jgi:uncharacterized membrane protein YhaH (DUF805 family)|nr:Integral rane protein [Solimicrobium sp.]